MSGPPAGRLAAALEYAARVHAGQTRAGTGAPKLAHLMAVAAAVMEDAGRAGAIDEEEAVAALLHDAAEDGGGRPRLDDLRERFGPRVAGLVEALSDSLDPDPPPWRRRKEAYLELLREEDRADVLRISLADKLDNARAIVAAHAVIGEPFWDRFHPREDTLWYYGALAAVFSRRAPGPMAAELARTVQNLRDGAGP